MTDQTSSQLPPPTKLYNTWLGYDSCFAEPEAVLASFLENQKSRPRQFDNSKVKERRERVIAWYLFFTIYEYEIWETRELEKLEKQEEGHDHQQGQGYELTDKDEDDSEDDSEDEREEEDQCRKRLMQRHEIFADWKQGRHPFFYEDEDMPDTGEQDDRAFNMSLIFHCPKWQDYLEECVKVKRESEGYKMGE
ncbi:hypothetical protein QBC32DRAFT_394449 [Pseudoneurospora amorphoporcata]|uniref:Uncharacterized protein n=1 Tax=Pseudoneurospora amorphoporcata TaxID=241081 RepID=A0AAN6P390_9PEZI|nr:hypothetical protein QBC32DRAFT_394449 [Pseudoneurospora amorphoporcata]